MESAGRNLRRLHPNRGQIHGLRERMSRVFQSNLRRRRPLPFGSGINLTMEVVLGGGVQAMRAFSWRRVQIRGANIKIQFLKGAIGTKMMKLRLFGQTLEASSPEVSDAMI